MCLIHKNITVSGSVQGVGFRYSCKKIAQSIGIKGFTRNLHDGNVYIEAEGNNSQITLFIKWCYDGPAHARVHDVIMRDGELKNFNHFDILR